MTWEHFTSYEHLTQLGIAIGIFLLFLIFRKIFVKYVFSLLLRLGKKAPTDLFSNIFLAFQRPFQWLFIIIGLYFAVRSYPYLNHANENFIKLVRAGIIFLVSWGLLNLSSTSSQFFRKINEKTNIKIDEILIPLLSRALQFVIIAISLSVILQEFGYRIDGFVAGLGLGGLAFSLAAKDALANFFGGIVIITEKPFTIGDWVATPSVEGTVEDITFRSTKIRTFAQALVTVPNATLANDSITNWSKMGKRQITFSLRLTYGTPREKIKRVTDRIEHILKSDTRIHPETILVSFDEYKEDGLGILLYFFTKTTVWEEYLEIREDINLKIMEILEDEAVTIAVPSRRLFVDGEYDEQTGATLRQQS